MTVLRRIRSFLADHRYRRSRMTKARPFTVALAAAGAVTLAAALGRVCGHVAYRPRLVPVSDDIPIGSFAPGVLGGGKAITGALARVDRLAAGGMAGGAAITYLKFH